MVLSENLGKKDLKAAEVSGILKDQGPYSQHFIFFLT
jgi:hypothetical protein